MGEAPLVLAQAKILSEADGDCVAIERVHGKSPVLLICEHASRTLPEHFGDLGLSEDALSSHIAWDPGDLDGCKVGRAEALRVCDQQCQGQYDGTHVTWPLSATTSCRPPQTAL